MIRPTKYLDLDSCVLNIAAHVLRKLSSSVVLTYDEVLRSVETTLTPRARTDFPLAIDFLFLLGRVNYDEGTDTLRASSLPQDEEIPVGHAERSL